METRDIAELLGDQTTLLILHALDGAIWNASHAACEQFGYSSEEFQQLYLANIKPKTLRLSDVCKSRKDESAPTIFERRNGSRFPARVKTRVINTSFDQQPGSLVLLELQPEESGQAADTDSPPQLKLNDSIEFIRLLEQEIQAPIKKLLSSLQRLQYSELNREQRDILGSALSNASDISQLGSATVDGFQLGTNTFVLEKQPFNIIDIINLIVEEHRSQLRHVSAFIDPSCPELVYGDVKRIQQIMLGVMCKAVRLYQPGRMALRVRSLSSDADAELLQIDIQLLAPDFRDTGNIDKQQHAINCNESLNNTGIMEISKKVAATMNGALRCRVLADHSLNIQLQIEAPEVHDLGLRGDRHFLKGRHLLLVESHESLLTEQLRSWGAQVDRFNRVRDVREYLQSSANHSTPYLLYALNNDSEELTAHEQQALDQLATMGVTNLLIGHEDIRQKLHSTAMFAGPPCQPARIGNFLSHLLKTELPYPYCNHHHLRSNADATTDKRVLIVQDDDFIRDFIRRRLEEGGISSHAAVNGIDAVIACVHSHYDVIIMDTELPYMDGIETVTHLRRSSEQNATTPIIAISPQLNTNIRLALESVGVSDFIEKPVDAQELVERVCQAISKSCQLSQPVGDTGKQPLRRSNEKATQAGQQSCAFDTHSLERMIEDTSLDICTEMVTLFLDETRQSIEELKHIAGNGNWKQFRPHLHALRSSARTFGCEGLYQIATQLENETQHSNTLECMRLTNKLPTVFAASEEQLTTYFRDLGNTGNVLREAH